MVSDKTILKAFRIHKNAINKTHLEKKYIFAIYQNSYFGFKGEGKLYF